MDVIELMEKIKEREAEEAAAEEAKAEAAKADETKPEAEAAADENAKAEPAGEKKAEAEDAKADESAKAEPAGDGKTARENRLVTYSKAFFYVLVIGAATIIAFFFIGVGIKSTDGPVGYWKITEASSGGVVMTDVDAEAMGLRDIGSFKLNRGGDCVITYLGKKSEGTWKKSGSGKVVITYGEDKKIVGKINDKTGVMTAKDNESMVYKLEK